MHAFADLHLRLDQLSAGPAGTPNAEPLIKLESLPSEGYVRALSADARRGELLDRLVELARAPDHPPAAAEARAVAVDLSRLEEAVAGLRTRLARLRAELATAGALD